MVLKDGTKQTFVVNVKNIQILTKQMNNMSKYKQLLDRLIIASVDNVLITKELESLRLESISFEQSNMNYSVTVQLLRNEIEDLKNIKL